MKAALETGARAAFGLQTPRSLMGDFIQKMRGISNRSQTGQTRAACTALKQDPVWLLKCCASFENPPRSRRRLQPKGCADACPEGS